jgi:hypothetical protein
LFVFSQSLEPALREASSSRSGRFEKMFRSHAVLSDEEEPNLGHVKACPLRDRSTWGKYGGRFFVRELPPLMEEVSAAQTYERAAPNGCAELTSPVSQNDTVATTSLT